MDLVEPMKKPKSEYADIIARISSDKTPVGIDVQYTHAIIIDYLRQVTDRLAKIESMLAK